MPVMRATVFHEIAGAAWMLAGGHLGPGVQGVVDQLLHRQRGEVLQRHTGTLLQTFDGAEEGPVLALEFHISGRG
jgi:hypothetical protein